MSAVLLLALLVASPRAAEEERARIEASVLAVSGPSVYLDRGRDAGIEAEDPVLLFPAGGLRVEALVRDVSRSTARAELPPGSPAVEPGARAEVLVPAARLAGKAGAKAPSTSQGESPASAPASRPAAPAPHPPWTRPPEAWNEDAPLLAPAFDRAREERPLHLSGRFYSRFSGTWDSQGEGREYFLGALGADARLENLLGRSGALEFRGEIIRRSALFDRGENEADTTFLVRRLSYSEGGTPGSPTRFEVGRFLLREFPELGAIDGADLSFGTAGGSRFGASAGRMPEPFPEMEASDDLQASVYGRVALDREGSVRVGGAYQSTWHEGERDRNLLVATLDADLGKSFSLRSSALVDYYGSGDAIKSRGLELTELFASASWRFERAGGLALSVSRRRIPEILRNEFSSPPPANVRDDRLDRGSASAWVAPTPRIRVHGRADLWRDEEGSGGGGEAGLALRELLGKRSEVGASVFTAEGSFTDGEGVRAYASRSFEGGYGRLGYELRRFDVGGFAASASTLAHHAVTAGLDLRLGRGWDLSLLGDRRFGDEQDSIGVSLLLQTRF